MSDIKIPYVKEGDLDYVDLIDKQVKYCQSADENGNFPQLPNAESTPLINEVVEDKLKKEGVGGVEVVTPKSDEQLQKEFLESEENINNALSLASQVLEVVGDNWFTSLRLARKGQLTEIVATQKMQLLKMFGLAQVKIGNFRDGKDNVRKPMWKITIGKEHKVKALKDVIQYHQDCIDNFQSELNSLQNA